MPSLLRPSYIDATNLAAKGRGDDTLLVLAAEGAAQVVVVHLDAHPARLLTRVVFEAHEAAVPRHRFVCLDTASDKGGRKSGESGTY